MFHLVIVPLDGSELAECTLPYAKELMKDGCAESVILLSVVPGIESWGVFGRQVELGAEVLSAAELEAEGIKHAEAYLETVKQRLASEGVSVGTAIMRGAPASAILSYAEEKNADLILIGTHGYTGIRRFFVGSVAERVLREAERPVLLIKPLAEVE